MATSDTGDACYPISVTNRLISGPRALHQVRNKLKTSPIQLWEIISERRAGGARTRLEQHKCVKVPQSLVTIGLNVTPNQSRRQAHDCVLNQDEWSGDSQRFGSEVTL
ncbi:hypothetical protein CBL_02524 [Carabus blaptoides fortunei]